MLLRPPRRRDPARCRPEVALPRSACVESRATPLVVVDRRPPGGGVDTVRADFEDRRFRARPAPRGPGASDDGRPDGPAGGGRPPTIASAGFRRAIAAAGGLPPPRVLRGAFSIESGREMAKLALGSTPRPTALFAASNFIAIGVLHALAELKIRVPEDVAVVGFDDLPPAMVTFPFLTVAAQPAVRDGPAKRRDAARSPVRIACGAGQGYREVVLPTHPVVRRSSRRSRGYHPPIRAEPGRR